MDEKLTRQWERELWDRSCDCEPAKPIGYSSNGSMPPLTIAGVQAALEAFRSRQGLRIEIERPDYAMIEMRRLALAFPLRGLFIVTIVCRC